MATYAYAYMHYEIVSISIYVVSPIGFMQLYKAITNYKQMLAT